VIFLLQVEETTQQDREMATAAAEAETRGEGLHPSLEHQIEMHSSRGAQSPHSAHHHTEGLHRRTPYRGKFRGNFFFKKISRKFSNCRRTEGLHRQERIHQEGVHQQDMHYGPEVNNDGDGQPELLQPEPASFEAEPEELWSESKLSHGELWRFSYFLMILQLLCSDLCLYVADMIKLLLPQDADPEQREKMQDLLSQFESLWQKIQRAVEVNPFVEQ
jgi:hypothetical protein